MTSENLYFHLSQLISDMELREQQKNASNELKTRMKLSNTSV